MYILFAENTIDYAHPPHIQSLTSILTNTGSIVGIIVLLLATGVTIYTISSNTMSSFANITNNMIYIISSETVKYITTYIHPTVRLIIYAVFGITGIIIIIIYIIKYTDLAFKDIASSIIKGLIYTLTVYVINTFVTKTPTK